MSRVFFENIAFFPRPAKTERHRAALPRRRDNGTRRFWRSGRVPPRGCASPVRCTVHGRWYRAGRSGDLPLHYTTSHLPLNRLFREIRAGITSQNPPNRSFKRTNLHRSCRDRSPDLSARYNLPSTEHPPGDVLPRRRNHLRRRKEFR